MPIITLDALPLLPDGRVDRHRLRASASMEARTSAVRPACQLSATRGASVVAMVTAISAWGST